jgi:hypothetical protein
MILAQIFDVDACHIRTNARFRDQESYFVIQGQWRIWEGGGGATAPPPPVGVVYAGGGLGPPPPLV